MPFETAITVRAALDHIQRGHYALPNIQRELVWSTEQIECLFDSLMRNYPIGSFLFWKIKAENVEDYRFYSFVRDYHERDAPHCPPFDSIRGQGLTGVLDGQQRLTALNIGLRGSHATKKPYKRRDNPDAYPKRYLYLNLRKGAPNDDRGMLFDFRFLTERDAEVQDDGQYWYRVSKVLELDKSSDVHRYVKKHGLVYDEDDYPHDTLDALRNAVFVQGTISFYKETAENLEKVLDIFVRTNSGGTVLSRSDLLLSTATATWTRRNAREEVHELVDAINRVPPGFDFPNEFALKAGLMLSEISDVGFKLENFNRDNMKRLEEAWDSVAEALRVTVRLVARLGFSSANLTARNALLPIAYYIRQRGFADDFVDGARFKDDRLGIRWWLTRSLLKRGIWGAGPDTLLTRLRRVVKDAGQAGFPSQSLADSLTAGRGRLEFTNEEIEDLSELDFGRRAGGRAFVALSLLYPMGVSAVQQVHVDHVFPQNAFSPSTLTRAGLETGRHEGIRMLRHRLPNLQLLSGPENQSKGASMPAEWLARHFESEVERSQWCRDHDWGPPGEVPSGMDGFEPFYEARRKQIVKKLSGLLRQGPDGGPI